MESGIQIFKRLQRGQHIKPFDPRTIPAGLEHGEDLLIAAGSGKFTAAVFIVCATLLRMVRQCFQPAVDRIHIPLADAVASGQNAVFPFCEEFLYHGTVNGGTGGGDDVGIGNRAAHPFAVNPAVVQETGIDLQHEHHHMQNKHHHGIQVNIMWHL